VRHLEEAVRYEEVSGAVAPSLNRRARLALLIALLGIATSLVPTILFLLVIEDKKGEVLGWEILADFPVHLLTAIIGAVVGIVGELMFRRYVRQEVQEYVSRSERVVEELTLERAR